MIEIEIANRQTARPVDEGRLRSAAQRVLQQEGVRRATVSIAIVSDSTIHQLNRQYLQHDYPTDVLSFLFQPGPERLEGEVIVSADMAARSAERYRWTADDELLLYVLHGVLHLTGYEDESDAQRTIMRQKEAEYLAACGLSVPVDPDHCREGGNRLRHSSTSDPQEASGDAS